MPKDLFSHIYLSSNRRLSKFTAALFSSVLKQVLFETCFRRRLIGSGFHQGWNKIGVIPCKHLRVIQTRSLASYFRAMGVNWHRDHTTVLCGCGMLRQGKSSRRLRAIQAQSLASHFRAMGASWHRDQPTVLCGCGMLRQGKSSRRLRAIQPGLLASHFRAMGAN
jgi:hypothetical protein